MPMFESEMKLVERLYDAFNRRDSEEIAELCDERMGFYPIVTAEIVGREAPYVGPDGLHEYLDDIAKIWEQLIVTPSELERKGNAILVRGRVYARSRELGIRDVPVAWVWELREGCFVRGEVFTDPEQALTRFGIERSTPA